MVEAPSELTIYTTPKCQGCKLTKDKLTEAGLEFVVVDLEENPQFIDEFHAQGLMQAPVIETSDGVRTAGFRPDRIKAIVAAAGRPSTEKAGDPAPVRKPPPASPTERQGRGL